MDVLIFDMSSFTNLLIIVPHRGELKKDKLLEVTYIEVLQLSTKDGLNKSTIAEIPLTFSLAMSCILMVCWKLGHDLTKFV